MLNEMIATIGIQHPDYTKLAKETNFTATLVESVLKKSVIKFDEYFTAHPNKTKWFVSSDIFTELSDRRVFSRTLRMMSKSGDDIFGYAVTQYSPERAANPMFIVERRS